MYECKSDLSNFTLPIQNEKILLRENVHWLHLRNIMTTNICFYLGSLIKCYLFCAFRRFSDTSELHGTWTARSGNTGSICVRSLFFQIPGKQKRAEGCLKNGWTKPIEERRIFVEQIGTVWCSTATRQWLTLWAGKQTLSQLLWQESCRHLRRRRISSQKVTRT